jgi:hypothetical protein
MKRRKRKISGRRGLSKHSTGNEDTCPSYEDGESFLRDDAVRSGIRNQKKPIDTTFCAYPPAVCIARSVTPTYHARLDRFLRAPNLRSLDLPTI